VPRAFVLIDVGLSDHADDKRVSKRGSAMQTPLEMVEGTRWSFNAVAGSPYTIHKFGYSPDFIWIIRCAPFRRVLIYRSPLHGSLGFVGFHPILKLDLILV
jgi:hypothetical protein